MVNPYRSLLPSTVGFGKLMSTLEEFDSLLASGFDKPSSYPPYNIYDTDKSTTNIEVAVAGFKKTDLEITYENNWLKVVGVKSQTDTTERTYSYHGLAKRDFTFRVKLAENVEIESAVCEDGILLITLKSIVPEEKKPKKILIN